MKPKIQKYVCIFVKLNCYSSNNNFCKIAMDFKEACISRVILKCSYGCWELPLFLQPPLTSWAGLMVMFCSGSGSWLKYITPGQNSPE